MVEKGLPEVFVKYQLQLLVDVGVGSFGSSQSDLILLALGSGYLRGVVLDETMYAHHLYY